MASAHSFGRGRLPQATSGVRETPSIVLALFAVFGVVVADQLSRDLQIVLSLPEGHFFAVVSR